MDSSHSLKAQPVPLHNSRLLPHTVVSPGLELLAVTLLGPAKSRLHLELENGAVQMQHVKVGRFVVTVFLSCMYIIIACIIILYQVYSIPGICKRVIILHNIKLGVY